MFGHNTAARALYERMGYEPVNIPMSKALPSEPPVSRLAPTTGTLAELLFRGGRTL